MQPNLLNLRHAAADGVVSFASSIRLHAAAAPAAAAVNVVTVDTKCSFDLDLRNCDALLKGSKRQDGTSSGRGKGGDESQDGAAAT